MLHPICSSGSPPVHTTNRSPSAAAGHRVSTASHQIGGSSKCAAIGARAHEVRVAELAHRALTVAFAPGPQVAPRESEKHRGPPCVGAFALDRVEDFLDCVRHARRQAGVSVSC